MEWTLRIVWTTNTVNALFASLTGSILRFTCYLRNARRPMIVEEPTAPVLLLWGAHILDSGQIAAVGQEICQKKL